MQSRKKIHGWNFTKTSLRLTTSAILNISDGDTVSLKLQLIVERQIFKWKISAFEIKEKLLQL